MRCYELVFRGGPIDGEEALNVGAPAAWLRCDVAVFVLDGIPVTGYDGPANADPATHAVCFYEFVGYDEAERWLYDFRRRDEGAALCAEGAR